MINFGMHNLSKNVYYRITFSIVKEQPQDKSADHQLLIFQVQKDT